VFLEGALRCLICSNSPFLQKQKRKRRAAAAGGEVVMTKVRSDKKHTHTPEVKTTNKTVFFLALEKNHLPLQGVAAVHIEDI
jgi:hypothetical protein